MSTQLGTLILLVVLVACGDESNGDGIIISLSGTDGMMGSSGGSDGGMNAAADALTEIDAMVEPDTSIAPPSIDVPVAPMATGTCPEFMAGRNAFSVNGDNRAADVYLPGSPEGAPVLFIWHGLGDSAGNMGRAFGASGLASQYGAIVVVPHSSGRFQQSEWSYFGGDPETDGRFFNEMLGCLDAAYDVDMSRIYTTGFSAGALWSTWLLMNRSEYLAAVLLFSGGAGGVNPYGTPSHDTPVLAFYGGQSDTFGGGFINFAAMTNELTTNLVADGHFVVLCNHNGGHRIPLDPRAYALPFLFEHTFTESLSPYRDGLGPEWPSYCDVQSVSE